MMYLLLKITDMKTIIFHGDYISPNIIVLDLDMSDCCIAGSPIDNVTGTSETYEEFNYSF